MHGQVKNMHEGLAKNIVWIISSTFLNHLQNGSKKAHLCAYG